jgi:hypothetical protein
MPNKRSFNGANGTIYKAIYDKINNPLPFAFQLLPKKEKLNLEIQKPAPYICNNIW